MIRIPQIFVLALLGLSLAGTAAATTVLPISLERLSKAAELIFYGTAISNEVKLDDVSGRVVTLTTFKVIDVVKGNAGNTHTIKQIGGHLPGSNIIHKIHGVPHFTEGKNYVVFLPQVSNLGFSSPLGLSQGRIAVHDVNGIQTVGGRQNSKAAISATAKKPSGTSLADYLKTVRKLTAE